MLDDVLLSILPYSLFSEDLSGQMDGEHYANNQMVRLSRQCRSNFVFVRTA